MMQQQNSAAQDVPIEAALIDSQVEILKSDTIALAVIKDLRLVDDPEFTSGGGGLIGIALGAFRSLFSSSIATPSEHQRQRGVLARLQGNLSVKRIGLSYVIDISYRSTSSERAAQIANAIAEAYIVDSLESKYQASRRASVWLQDRLKELRAQASIAERAVVDFKAKNNIVDAGGRLLTEQQLGEMNSSLTSTRAQRAEAEARLSRITSILDGAASNLNDGTLINNLGTVTDTLNNQVIVRLRQQYLDIAARESDWTRRFGPSHLAVVNLRNQMREIRNSIADELRRIAESFKSDAEIAKAREESTQRNLNETIAQSNDTSNAQIVLRDLESNSQSARALADNFLQLYMVTVQQQSFPITEARLITPAAASLAPFSPRTNVILTLAIVAGVVLAGMLAFLTDMMDRVFRSGPHVESVLGIGCLATIPTISNFKEKTTTKQAKLKALRRGPGEKASAAPAGRDTDVPAANEGMQGRRLQHSSGEDVSDTVFNAPFSRFAEAIRAIKIAADLHHLDDKSVVLGITSSLPNEGKSTVSRSLAQVIAQSGSKVLLVDGDIRHPSLTRHLAPEAKVGLIDVCLGQVQLKDAIFTDPRTGLQFLPCVVPQHLSNSADLLASSKFEKIFQDMRQQYDRIVLDLSPIAPVIDVRGTGRLVDSYVMVIEWAQTNIDAVERSLLEVPAVRQKLLGAVLNKVNMDQLNRYDFYRGDYYHNRYYQKYGYVD